jgi:hypothetical protein
MNTGDFPKYLVLIGMAVVNEKKIKEKKQEKREEKKQEKREEQREEKQEKINNY